MTKRRVTYVENTRPNHILHLLLSLVTFGFWIPIWFLVTMKANLRRRFLR